MSTDIVADSPGSTPVSVAVGTIRADSRTGSWQAGRVPDDVLLPLLGKALSGLVQYVDERPSDATYDDDLQALVTVAAILSHADPAEAGRLVEVLGPRVAADLGVQRPPTAH
jgi:hypothetical protein